MYTHVIFLSLAITLTHAVSVNDLKVFVEEIHTELENNQATLKTELLLAKYNLAYEETNVIKNLTNQLSEASEDYWLVIEGLEEAAKTDGRTISQCVEPGNEKFYKLSNSTFNSLLAQVNAITDEGYGIVTNSSNSTSELTEKLEVLETKVRECSDDTCAEKLYLEAEIYYTLLNGSFEDISLQIDYVNNDLTYSLYQIELDRLSFVQSYEVILANVIACIN